MIQRPRGLGEEQVGGEKQSSEEKYPLLLWAAQLVDLVVVVAGQTVAQVTSPGCPERAW